MSKKQVFTTIVCAMIMAISTIQFFGGIANGFVMEGNKIFFDIAEKEIASFGVYFLVQILAWKSIFPKRDWVDLLCLEGIGFQFFMLMITGWFAQSWQAVDFSTTLGIFSGYMAVATFSYVFFCILLRTMFGVEQSSEKLKQHTVNNEIIAAKAISNLMDKEIVVNKDIFLESMHKALGGKHYDG